MFIHPALRCKKLKTFPQGRVFMQAKLQGYRATAFKQPNGEVLVFGRDQRPHLEFTARFPRLLKEQWFKQFKANAPPNSSIDAEIYVKDQPDSMVATALRDEAIPLVIETFAVPVWGGKELFNVGLDYARDLFHSKRVMDGQSFAVFSEFDKRLEEAAKLSLALFLGDGYEGLVIKRHNYDGWWKMKPAQTCDTVVTGVIWGNGKYQGQIGSLVVSLYNPIEKKWYEVASVSGMDDEMRRSLSEWHNRGDLVGQVVEITYQELAGRGGLKHPRFRRLRDDKPVMECTMDQLGDGDDD